MRLSSQLVTLLAISATASAMIGAQPIAAKAVAQGRAPATVTARRDSLQAGERVLRAMRDKYAGKWFKTMTFVQTTTQTLPDGTTKTSTWYETMAAPSRLRIDIGNPRDGNGVLYTADSVFRFRNGAVVLAAAETNELVPLLMDVYVAPLERTAAALRAIGVDLATTHDDTWDSRPVTVVGARAGDLRAPQFWIDKERLVLVRQIESIKGDTTRLLDIKVGKYQPMRGLWLPTIIEIGINGRVIQLETYSEIKLDPPINADIFDVNKWTSAPHWAADRH